MKDWATDKTVRDTPEEQVRQDYEKVLCHDYGYLKEQMDIEVLVQRGSRRREKADLVVYKTTDAKKRAQGADVLGIVEAKRKDRKDGINQLISYMTATSCAWGVWTNGEEIEYLWRDHASGEVKRDAIYQIPRSGETIEDIGSLQNKASLKPASNLKLIFRRILNTLYTNTNISRREKLGNEMIRLLFCKMQDERYDVEGVPKFRIGANEDKTAVAQKVKRLFDEVKKDLEVEGIFEGGEQITLDDNGIAYVVGELQMYSLIGADQDVVGDAFEVFAESKLVGEKGEFFTPREIVKIAVRLVNPKPDEMICDPACGSGGFLIFALSHIWEQMREDRKWKNMPAGEFELEKRRMAKKTICGIDKEIDLVKITKAYMSIIGDGGSNIVQQNSLHAPEDFDGNAKNLFVEDTGQFKKFDVILTNPPFGSKETKVLEAECAQFDLGHKWKRDEEGEFVKTDKVVKTPPQELFIERCLDMLKEGGRLAIVLPETYFHAPTKKHIIQYMQQGNNIKAVIDLPHNTFRPHCNAKTLLLVLEKGAPQKDVIFGVAEQMGKNHLGKVMMKPVEGKISDEVWDDTRYIQEEISRPDANENKHVFCKKHAEIKNDIYVPRYYWKRENYLSEDENIDWLPLGDLVEEGIMEVHKGHGSPPGEYKGLGDVPYVRAGDIGNLSIYKNPVSGVPEHIYQQVKGTGVELRARDLIFVKEGSYRVGDVAVLLPTDTEILLNSHCLVFRIVDADNKYEIDAFYLAYLITHELTKRQLYNKVFIDTTLPNIGGRWRELHLPLHRDSEKRSRIKERMKQIVAGREKIEREIIALREEALDEAKSVWRREQHTQQ